MWKVRCSRPRHRAVCVGSSLRSAVGSKSGDWEAAGGQSKKLGVIPATSGPSEVPTGSAGESYP